ncbi:MAG TPA: S46 family peptidase [Candidatus Hydrogenedentes bacterium]|nr:S46 family peptidase [Candidatus Hydrogenedentota bacterium]
MKNVLFIAVLMGAAVAAGAFENPGGMWTPMQIGEHAKILSELGVEHPETLSDTLHGPLSSVVWLGGCSASFVSPEGLIVTNHHCVISILQFNSTPDADYVQNGYIARTRDQELKAPPSSRIYVDFEFEDVTAAIRDGLEKIHDPLKRMKEIERRSTELAKACEAKNANLKCEVASYFDGQRYYLVKRIEIKDLRLVEAPPMSVGSFGGDIDNWHWPRHAGDFAFLRAYVDKDGNSVLYSPDNVPYKPKSYFKIASEPLHPDDFVMVAGFPGHTDRLKTSFEYKYLIDTQNPLKIEIFQDTVDIYKDLSASDAELKVKLGGPIFYRMNSLLFLEALQEQVKRMNLVSIVEANEKGLSDWIHADPQRTAQWGDVLEDMECECGQYARKMQDRMLLDYVTRSATLVSSAYAVLRMAEERPKKDWDREPDYQEKNWEKLIASEESNQKNYDRRIDVAGLEYLIKRVQGMPGSRSRSKLLAAFPGSAHAGEKGTAAILNEMYAGSSLESLETRQKLFREATVRDLRQSQDPLIQLALRLRPLLKKKEDIDKRYGANLALLKPKYMDALLQYKGGMIAPDANATLRITYGTVRGYKPQAGSPEYYPFSCMSELLKKDTGEHPFNSPPALLTAAKAGPFGRYIDAALNDLPLDILSDLDITGGNSGSPVLNKRFELTGLVFDGNYEGISSKYLFDKQISRTIAVDMRYVLWYLGAVDKADTLLSELGIIK